MILEEISEALQSIGVPVYYGQQAVQSGEKWNYIVFRRTRTVPSDSKHSKAEHFTVAYVQENYVEPGIYEQIAEAMTAIDGVKLSSADVEYEYVQKPGTGIIVEVMAMDFARGVKR